MSKLFTQIDSVWSGKGVNTKTKPESVYMTTRFISLSPDGELSAILLNRIGTLPPWFGLPFLAKTTPNRRAPRNKYPKKVTDGKLSPKKKKSLLRIMRKFNLDEDHGLQTMALLEAQGFKFKENRA